jgi:trehalose 6-phosphate synthase/phosphatase
VTLVLWPLLHYVLWTETDGRQEINWWNDYVKLNQKFADKIAEMYQPGDIGIPPSILANRSLGARLLPCITPGNDQEEDPKCQGRDVHPLPLPFIRILSLSAQYPPSSVKLTIERKEVITGMLGANMIGFQNYSYSRHFISSCTRVLGFESTKSGVDALGARIAIEAFPIGIDVSRVERELASPSAQAQMVAIQEIYAGKKIIVGRDRLDEVRGVLQKLRVFEIFLERYPEWHGRVVLIQVTSEAQHHAPKLEKKVADLVSYINGKYGSLEFTPVHHYHHQLDPDQYFALLRVADLGLITSVRDGLNTMGPEYVVCQKGRNGPVILSEFSGTAASLTDALHVNPWDSVGVAKAINYALCMAPEDKVVRQSHLYQHVTTHTVQAWASLFLKRLMENLNSGEQSHTTPELDKTDLEKRYLGAKKRLLLFDYDGTLTPIVKEPSAAVPTPKLLESLQKLALDKKNIVWIISGRDQEFLMKHLGHIRGLGFSAEHGCFVKQPLSPDGDWLNLTENLDLSWHKDVLKIFEFYTERTMGLSSRTKVDCRVEDRKEEMCLDVALQERGPGIRCLAGFADANSSRAGDPPKTPHRDSYRKSQSGNPAAGHQQRPCGPPIG